MDAVTKQFASSWVKARTSQHSDRSSAAIAQLLSQIVDAGLFAIICLAPFVFGGRHDLGRLVLVVLVAITAAAWFARQAVHPISRWHRSGIYAVLLCAAGWLLLQITPLPAQWVDNLSPEHAELLPLWNAVPSGQAAGSAAAFGEWRTLSLVPHETAKSLAMLVTYGMLFVVVSQRIGQIDDARRLLSWVGVSSVLMAAFGLLQHFTSDGRFFWFYEYPFRTTNEYVSGSFINRNHFASFLVLGMGPLAASLIELTRRPATPSRPATVTKRNQIVTLAVVTAITLVAFAILCSLSRGGAIVLLVSATVFLLICLSRRLLDQRHAYGLLFFGIAVTGLLSCYGYDQVSQRLDDFADASMDSIDHHEGRRKIWSANVAAFQAAWLTGAGAGTHREIYPVYLPETHTREYTHAENGYLQIATETGIVGLTLLVAVFAVGGGWCIRCWQFFTSPRDIVTFAGCAAGLAASAVHSAFDFVWYIPACMSIALILAACVFRLSHFARGNAAAQSDTRDHGVGTLARGRWLELAVAIALVGGWSAYTYFGPAIAAVHWDRYLRASLADNRLVREQLTEFISGNTTTALATRQALSRTMVHELRRVVAWDPQHARAHARLADRLMVEFELRNAASANSMDVTQIRDAAMRSNFESTLRLRNWLDRAFGKTSVLLFEARNHARQAARLCPLQGEAYLYLADLCFLDGVTPAAAQAYVNQGLRVRPYDKNVLYRAGRQELLFGKRDAALRHWSRCFHGPGAHQLQIIYRLVSGGVPAAQFIETFRPEWPDLRHVWINYRERGSNADLEALLAYAAEVSDRQASSEAAVQPDTIWFWQAMMYADVGRDADAVVCLERAYASNPRQFFVRYALQKSLIAADRYAEAEPHVRWCLARRPADKNLSNALKNIAKHRLAEREVIAQNPSTHTRTWQR